MIENASEESDKLWCLSQESFPFQDSVKESQVCFECLITSLNNALTTGFNFLLSFIISYFIKSETKKKQVRTLISAC